MGQKQFHIVAGKPILNPDLLQPTNGTFEELVQEGIDSIPLLESILQTALSRCKNAQYEIGPVKDKSRYNIKATTRRYESPRQNTDYCRSFIYVDNATDVIRLANFFRPSNNPNVLKFEDTFAVPKITTDLRRLQVKFKLPNGHISEIQIRLKGMKKAFETSHDAYEKQAAGEKRYPDPASRPINVQKLINRQARRRLQANKQAAEKLPFVNDLIHQRRFYKVGEMPVMVVNEPFTGERYTVIPLLIDGIPAYTRDNSYLVKIDNNEEGVSETNRDNFINSSMRFAKESLSTPILKIA